VIYLLYPRKQRILEYAVPRRTNGYVPKTNCISYTEWISETPDVNRIIETACSLLGRPYLWGGTSTKAVDCSGLMKTAYLSQAVILARDASQQARYGEILTITDSTQFKPGDLLFFGRSKDHITHVGMYKGNNQYVHSSGLVRINSLNPQSPEYILTGGKVWYRPAGTKLAKYRRNYSGEKSPLV
jgi:cell wall-associated NlpC family hydrolase